TRPLLACLRHPLPISEAGGVGGTHEGVQSRPSRLDVFLGALVRGQHPESASKCTGGRSDALHGQLSICLLLPEGKVSTLSLLLHAHLRCLSGRVGASLCSSLLRLPSCECGAHPRLRHAHRHGVAQSIALCSLLELLGIAATEEGAKCVVVEVRHDSRPHCLPFDGKRPLQVFAVCTLGYDEYIIPIILERDVRASQFAGQVAEQ